MKFEVEFTPGAEEDLDYYAQYVQRIIVKAILVHLQFDANVPTKRRKQLRPNPLAPWELRVSEYRVFYEIQEDMKVKVVAIGHKEHNDLFIRGKKAEI